jgi:hypothetical protein
VVFCIKAECPFYLNLCLEAGVKGDVILAILYRSEYSWTQSSMEKHVLVVISDISTPTGSDNIGTEQRNSLIVTLLHQAKLL